MGRFLLLFTLLVAANGLPYEVNVDNETGLKYFWFEGEGAKLTKVFLEGGPQVASKAEVEDETHFFLYTKSNPYTPHQLKPGCESCLNSSNFNPLAPLKIVCHGFWSSHESVLNSMLRDAYFRLVEDTNVIIINWEKLAQAPYYFTAATNTNPVGKYIATFVDYLVTQGYTTYDKIHFSGHSLGSHVGGFMGSYAEGTIGRITALDPALPLFGEAPDSGRIDRADAAFVDVIHTAGGGLGFMDPRGHIDFYPNNGKSSQPGCGLDLFSACSHARAYEFMAESIWHPNGFPAYQCNNWKDFDSGKCSMTKQAFLGEPVNTNLRGNYYLRTRASFPFGQENLQ